MKKFTILKLRQQWFKLKTKEFIHRNSAGLLVIVIFLPGVAVGDNFKMLMFALSQPLLLLSSIETSFSHKLTWMFVLSALFVVWSRAQKTAISGGAFMHYLDTLPIKKNEIITVKIRMLMRANHFLWGIVFASSYYLFNSLELTALKVCHYVFLLILLFSLQYCSVYKTDNKLKSALVFIAVIFTIQFNQSFEWLRLFVLTALLFIVLTKILVPQYKKQGQVSVHRKQIRFNFLSQNLYYQFLFKASLTGSLFRLGLITGLTTTLIVFANHFIKTSHNDFLPYIFVLEAVIAYYLSGFYLTFSDERQVMQSYLSSLPVKNLFWFSRDVSTLLLISAIFHGISYVWISQYFAINSIIKLLVFHILLLLICFPLRIKVKKNQTFISFVVLFILTAITLFNLS